MQVNCDQCHEDFKIKLKTKKHGIGIQETYFKCPHCKCHYTSFVTNTEARRRQKEIKLMTDKLSKIKDDEELLKQRQAISKKKAELKIIMDGLKKVYG
ncbi:hypothetical protein [Halalkalibacter oceani]|uniref:hypothetical protein n=1 Tax=Halalkalibacter oceani TaxID=1653776 RepID=UPI0033965417